MTGSEKMYRATSGGGTSYRNDSSWRDKAACGWATEQEQHGFTDGFGGNGQALNDARNLARKFCDNCPVRTECYAWADKEDAFVGVAAGLFFGFEHGRHCSTAGRRVKKL